MMTATITALRAGDESAFVILIDRYHRRTWRLARLFVRDGAVAEEVVQEAWLAVLRGLDRFEARSSLKRWISMILINRAKATASREGRSIPFSRLWGDPAGEPAESSVEADHFRAGDGPWPGSWIPFPSDWTTTPDEHLLSQETQRHVWACIDALPRGQRQVLVLRDVHGCSAEETSQLLQISEVNQRVLLHRGRSKVRRGLEAYLAGT